MNMKTEPVASRAIVAGVIAALVSVLRAFGVEVSEELSAAILDAVINIAPVAAIAWAAWSARKRVTPTALPRDDEGLPLVSVDDGAHRNDIEPAP